MSSDAQEVGRRSAATADAGNLVHVCLLFRLDISSFCLADGTAAKRLVGGLLVALLSGGVGGASIVSLIDWHQSSHTCPLGIALKKSTREPTS